MCKNSDYTPPPPPPPYVSPWHICEEEVIGDDFIKLLIRDMDDETGNFTAQVVFLADANKMPGHFGSYVSKDQYYYFKYIGDEPGKEFSTMIWEIPEIGTDRFHRDGHGCAQFLLYWFEENGFSFDLDS